MSVKSVFFVIAVVISSVGHASTDLGKSPWPSFRHDAKNSGRSNVVPQYNGTQPWSFQTRKGIFSTPVVDEEERIYVGSADKALYVLDASGQLLWSFPVGEVIDSAATLTVENNELMLTVPAGDGFLYHLSTDPHLRSRQDRIRWVFDASKHLSSKGIGYNWFEGNVVQGPDGTLYAGSTNWMYYAVDPLTGQLRWSLETGNMNWSAGAFASDGSIYWTSLDSKLRKVTPKGRELWSKRTWGYISASVALDENDSAYFGSSDHTFYALDRDGYTRWTFKTHDHIYGSAALGVNADNHTNAVYFTSADGHLYKLDLDGHLQWKFDAEDVIRSSPVIGPKPLGESGDIIYFGAANGKLYAVNSDGTLRWSFDTTPFGNRELEDRNDLNASPALGGNGIYIAGEHGSIWHVPYDYPLFNASDKRVSLTYRLPSKLEEMHFVTPGGSRAGKTQDDVSSAQILICELLVRQDGERIDAGIQTGILPGYRISDIVHISPPANVSIEKSADGRFLYIKPVDFWKPATQYTIRFNGNYIWDGMSFGAVDTGLGAYSQPFADQLSFTTSPSSRDNVQLAKTGNHSSAFIIKRLAVPYPSMMTSLNQIGFDSLQMIAGVVDVTLTNETNRNAILWVIGATINHDGAFAVDKNTDFMFPLNGIFQGNDFAISNTGTTFSVANINVPLDFELRGRLNPDLTTTGASLYGQVSVFSDLVYGPLLALGGLVNMNGIMPVAGTFLTSALPASLAANQKPTSMKVSEVEFAPPSIFSQGHVTVTFSNTDYVANEHLTGILVINGETRRPYFFDYKGHTKESVGQNGLLKSVTLTLPRFSGIQEGDEVVVMTDVFPLYRTTLR